MTLKQAITDHGYLTVPDLAAHVLDLDDEIRALYVALSDLLEYIHAGGTLPAANANAVIHAQNMVDAYEQREQREWLNSGEKEVEP